MKRRLLIAVLYFSIVGFSVCAVAKATKPVDIEVDWTLEPIPVVQEVEAVEEHEEPEVIEELIQVPDEPAFTFEEKTMLAKMTMAEAEGECLEGKCMVARVILNRVESDLFPNSIEEVIKQKGQFTSYKNGRYDNADPDLEVWKAVVMVCNEDWDESSNALFFERTPSDDTWQSENRAYLFTVGNHTFYK